MSIPVWGHVPSSYQANKIWHSQFLSVKSNVVRAKQIVSNTAPDLLTGPALTNPYNIIIGHDDCESSASATNHVLLIPWILCSLVIGMDEVSSTAQWRSSMSLNFTFLFPTPAVNSHTALRLCEWFTLIRVAFFGVDEETIRALCRSPQHFTEWHPDSQDDESVHHCGRPGRAVWRHMWGEGLSAESWWGLQKQKIRLSAHCDQRREVWQLDLAWDVSWQFLCCWLQPQGKDSDINTCYTPSTYTDIYISVPTVSKVQDEYIILFKYNQIFKYKNLRKSHL